MSESPVIDVHDNLRLLGTAHIATASVEAVRHRIATYQPDVVAVELCKSRHDALISDRHFSRSFIRFHARRRVVWMSRSTNSTAQPASLAASTAANNSAPGC